MMGVNCKYCKSNSIIKYGTRKSRDSRIQIFLCRSCKRFFSENTAFLRMRHKGKTITIALDLYCKNVSLRRISEHLNIIYGIKVTHVTILNWIRRYSTELNNFTKNLMINNSGSIHVDEMMVNIKGKWYWWWEAIDKDTKVILSTHLSRARKLSDAKSVFSGIKRRSNNNIDNVVTDGLPSYRKAFTKIFHTQSKPRPEHIKLIQFFDKVNNNVIERFHGSLRERTKIMRGFNKPHSAKKILDLWIIYYNFIRLHQTLDMTPAEAGGMNLSLNGNNRWMQMIELSNKRRVL